MRFNDCDPNFAILRLGNEKAIKVNADEALPLSGRFYEFNEQLFQLLAIAFEKQDDDALGSLWAAAHPYLRPNESGPAQASVPMDVNTPMQPLPPELRG
jgi:hypothetical protein